MKLYIRAAETHDVSDREKQRIVRDLLNHGGNPAEHVESLVEELYPEVFEKDSTFDDVPIDVVVRVYDTLKRRYQIDIDRYGDDTEVDSYVIKRMHLRTSIV